MFSEWFSVRKILKIDFSEWFRVQIRKVRVPENMVRILESILKDQINFSAQDFSIENTYFFNHFHFPNYVVLLIQIWGKSRR